MTITEKRNAAFLKANKARRRVLIAKDVLLQLERGTYNACSVYFTTDFTLTIINQEFIEKAQKCYVCGIGAAFASALRLGNKFETESSTINQEVIFSYLSRYFTFEQVFLIETVFEGYLSHCKYINWQPWRNVSLTAPRTDIPPAWMPELSYKNDLVRRIFQNIIDNKGTFIPVL